MTDLNMLIVFAKVVEANSFSEASRRLNMPVSTVSRRVAELEDRLGVRLLERSTRSLRLTDIGAEVLEHAQKSAELSDIVDSIVSNKQADVSGLLRLSAPPSIADSVLAPLIGAFQARHPAVRVQIMITDRMIDHIAEGIDVAFRFGLLRDSGLVARKILTYRHQLVATPSYLQRHPPPETPAQLLEHRLIAFSRWKTEGSWSFIHKNGIDKQTISFCPFLSMNDYSGIAAVLLSDAGIGDLPPVVHPELLRDGRLVEVMPDWRFSAFEFSLVHLGNRHITPPVRIFKEFSAQMIPTLFPSLPT